MGDSTRWTVDGVSLLQILFFAEKPSCLLQLSEDVAEPRARIMDSYPSGTIPGES